MWLAFISVFDEITTGLLNRHIRIVFELTDLILFDLCVVIHHSVVLHWLVIAVLSVKFSESPFDWMFLFMVSGRAWGQCQWAVVDRQYWQNTWWGDILPQSRFKAVGRITYCSMVLTNHVSFLITHCKFLFTWLLEFALKYFSHLIFPHSTSWLSEGQVMTLSHMLVMLMLLQYHVALGVLLATR